MRPILDIFKPERVKKKHIRWNLKIFLEYKTYHKQESRCLLYLHRNDIRMIYDQDLQSKTSSLI